jgi:hypothetical protein
VLDQNIDNAFKFSTNPNLTRWNPLMEIMMILDQMVSAYGHPMPNTLLQNNTLFRSVYSSDDAPKILFRWIVQCQEIQTLRDDPHTVT